MQPCASEVKRHISGVAKGTIISRRHLLLYGTPGAVDMAISRAIADYRIIRVARGLYASAKCKITDFTPLQIAQAKAEAFGRTLSVHPTEAARTLNSSEDTNQSATVFATNRSSTKFLFNGEHIYCKITSANMENLTDDNVGRAIKALWQIGRESGDNTIGEQAYADIYQRVPFFETSLIIDRWRSMPSWLMAVMRANIGPKWTRQANKFRNLKTPEWLLQAIAGADTENRETKSPRF